MELKIEEVTDCFDLAAECLYSAPDTKQNRVYINVNKLISYHTWSHTVSQQLKEELNDILYEDTGYDHGYNPNSPQQTLDKLVNCYGVPREELYDKDRRLSTSKDILENLKGKYKNRFTRTLQDYRYHQSKVTNLGQFLRYINVVPMMRNNEGDLIMEIAVNYEKINTNRYQTNTPSFQSLSTEETDIITAPEGWVIFNVDSGQIEPRLYYSWTVKDPLMDFLIEQYNDVYYAVADYCLRDSTEFVESNLHVSGSISKTERDAFKTLTNGGAYGAGKKKIKTLSKKIVFDEFARTNPEDAKLVKNIVKYKLALEVDNLPTAVRNTYTENYMRAKETLDSLSERVNFLYERFTERIINHPQRVEFLRKEEKLIESGERTFKTIFGDEIQARGSIYYLLNCAINNPLQGAVARLSAFSIVKAFKYIYENELENHLIYSLCKHDQDVYTIRKELVHLVKDTLVDFREYKLEGCHPIYSEYGIGLDYTK